MLDPTLQPDAPRVLLVGGGHAMLPALQRARRWTAAGARVTLLSDALLAWRTKKVQACARECFQVCLSLHSCRTR